MKTVKVGLDWNQNVLKNRRGKQQILTKID